MNRFKHKNNNGKIVFNDSQYYMQPDQYVVFYFKIHQTIFINHPETYILGKDLETAHLSLDT